MSVVLDASALLAYLQQEPGAEVVDGLLQEARMASVNWAEVVQKSISAGVEVEGLLDDLQALGMRIEPFLPVLTCDRAWAQLPLALDIQVLR